MGFNSEFKGLTASVLIFDINLLLVFPVLFLLCHLCNAMSCPMYWLGTDVGDIIVYLIAFFSCGGILSLPLFLWFVP